MIKFNEYKSYWRRKVSYERIKLDCILNAVSQINSERKSRITNIYRSSTDSDRWYLNTSTTTTFTISSVELI